MIAPASPRIDDFMSPVVNLGFMIQQWHSTCGALCRRSLADLVRHLAEQKQQIEQVTAQWATATSRPWEKLSFDGAPVTVWLLGWRPGDSTDIHDHTKSEAGIYVYRGELYEHVYTAQGEILPDKPFRCQRFDREVYAGSTLTIPMPYIHRMGNDAFDGVGVSIHAYLPALRKMILYAEQDMDGNDCNLIATSDWVDDTEAK